MIENVVVDLSHWNKNVDFKSVKEDAILGILHKATQGLTYVDPTYAARKKAAEEQGLLWGSYHFGIGENGALQAEHFLRTVHDGSKILTALDIEENQTGKNITPEQAEDFVNRVHQTTGRFPLVYGSSNFLKDFATPLLTQCPLWIANWGHEPVVPKGWNNWVFWQYTDGRAGPQPHTVKGIGPCDRDKFNGTTQELRKFWNA